MKDLKNFPYEKERLQAIFPSLELIDTNFLPEESSIPYYFGGKSQNVWLTKKQDVFMLYNPEKMCTLHYAIYETTSDPLPKIYNKEWFCSIELDPNNDIIATSCIINGKNYLIGTNDSFIKEKQAYNPQTYVIPFFLL